MENNLKCRMCGRGPNDIEGYLQRVTKIGGEFGGWECRPSCNPGPRTREKNILDAIAGDKPAEGEKHGG